MVGGVAAILHGAPLATWDLDLVPNRTAENLVRLEAVLAEMGAFNREHADWRPAPEARWSFGRGHHLLETTEGSIGVLGVVTGDRDYHALLAECDEISLWEGVTAHVVDLEMLIRLKQETGRDKDLAVVPLLRATLEERRKLASQEEGS